MAGVIRKIVLVLLFLTFGGAAFGMPIEQAIVHELVRMYELDTANYVIEVEKNRLETREVGEASGQHSTGGNPQQAVGYSQSGSMTDGRVSPSASGTLRNPTYSVTLRPLSNKQPLGLFTVAATVERDGQQVESAQVRLRVTKFADVLVAVDKIGMREEINPSMVQVRRVDVTNLYEKPLTSLEELAGMRSARLVRKGTVLTTACVEAPPDVESGRTVSIVYVDGACRVSTAGTVLQSGRAGDYVKVRNNGSGKVIMARVVDDSAVAVEP